MVDELATAVLIGVITGAVSSVATVAALKVHIVYLREGLQHTRASIADLYARVNRHGEVIGHVIRAQQHERSDPDPNGPRAPPRQ